MEAEQRVESGWRLRLAEGEVTLPAHAPAADPTDPEVELMLRFQRGERRCFDQLFATYRRPVINFAYRFTGRRDVAEELAQEIFVKCYRAAPAYRPEARFATWLFRIARNHCLNEVRRRRMRSEPLDPAAEPPSDGATPEAILQGKQIERRIDAALQGLPEKQRTALILCRFHGLSYEEIAATMRTSVSSVKSLLNRARQTLMTRLAPALERPNEGKSDDV